MSPILVLAAFASAPAPSYSADPQARPVTCSLCLYGPDNMVFEGRGRIYLVDTDHESRSRILELSADGKKLADWRVFTDAPHSRNGPEGIALDRTGDVLVTDAGAQRFISNIT
jgi:hypothetical protein